MFERHFTPIRLGSLALFLAFLIPSVAFAALNPPTVTVNGQNLPTTDSFPATLFPPPAGWSVVLTFDEPLSVPPTVHEADRGDGSFVAENVLQNVNLCGDQSASTTFCFTYTLPTTAVNGEFRFFVVSDAQNQTGDIVPTTGYRFILDTTPPSIGFGAFTNPSHLSLPTISGISDDSQSPIGVLIANSTLGVAQYHLTGGLSWSFALQQGQELAAGTYEVTASSTDRYGHTGFAATSTLTIDNSAPTITFSSGLGVTGFATSTSPTALFGVSDQDGDPFSATCWFNNDGPHACTAPSFTEPGTLLVGPNVFHIVATDSFGNSASTSRNFVIDKTAPTLIEDAPIATSSTTTPAYSFAASEAVTLAYSGSCSATTTTAAAGTSTITFNALAVGTYSNCRLTPTDLAGNLGAALVVSPFEISAPPAPTPTPTPPPSGGGGGSVGNGPPVANPSQGLPQGLILGEQTKAVEHAAPKAVEAVVHAAPPVKVAPPGKPEAPEQTPPATPTKKDTNQSAPEPQTAAVADAGLTLPPWLFTAAGGIVVIGGVSYLFYKRQ